MQCIYKLICIAFGYMLEHRKGEKMNAQRSTQNIQTRVKNTKTPQLREITKIIERRKNKAHYVLLQEIRNELSKRYGTK